MADGFVPPQEVRSNAKRGLELREKYGRGGTAVGVARARDLSNGASLPLDTIKRMNSYFARHEVDKKGEGWGKDSAGYIAWLLWGGDAGWSWAKGIIREQESKEKSMSLDLTTSYISIEKADRNPDGTLTVYGKATDDSIDIDQQICDAEWLDRAMPEWFKSGGNIREQHSQIAAGVAEEYERKGDGHYITALVVDPNSVKKVETGVLKGFSIGIKRPRVVRDTKAANGRIVDGQIVEVSLVDRPANPNAKLMLAKSVEGEASLVQVEEFNDEIVKHPGHGDQSVHGKPKGGASAAGAAGQGEGSAGGGGGSAEGGSGSSANGSSGSKPMSKKEAKAKVNEASDELDNGYKKVVEQERKPGQPMSPRYMDAAQQREDAFNHVEDAHNSIDRGNNSAAASSLRSAARVLKGEPAYNSAAKKFKEAADAIDNKPKKSTDADLRKALRSALQLLTVEKSEDVSMEKSTVELPVKVMGDILKFDKAQYEAARDALANLISIEAQESKEGHNEIRSIAHLLEAVSHLHAWYEGEEAEGEVVEEEEIVEAVEEKAADEKADDEAPVAGEDDEEADDEEAKKEADADEDAELCATCKETMKMCKCKSDAATDMTPTAQTGATLEGTTIVPPAETPKSVSADDLSAEVKAIVEEVVVKATAALQAKIDSLQSANEAVVEKSVSLEAELATAKSLALAGGPKRTAAPINVATSDLLTKAAVYKAKAQAATDPTLVKGYKQLAEEYLAKASEAQNN